MNGVGEGCGNLGASNQGWGIGITAGSDASTVVIADAVFAVALEIL